MKIRLLSVTALSLVFTASISMAGEKLSDAALKQKLLGYWQGPRYVFLYKSDGFCYPIGRMGQKAHWAIKGGVYYEEGLPWDILTLTNKKFVYRFRGGETVSRTKMTDKEGESFKKQTDSSN